MTNKRSKSSHGPLSPLKPEHLILLNTGENEFDELEEGAGHYLFTMGLGEKHLADFEKNFFEKTGMLERVPWLANTRDLLSEIIQRIQFLYLLKNAEALQSGGRGNDEKEQERRLSDLYFLLIIKAGHESLNIRFVDFRDKTEFLDLLKIKILTAGNTLIDKDLPIKFDELLSDFAGTYNLTLREFKGIKSAEVEILLNNTREARELIPEKAIYRGVKTFRNSFIQGSYVSNSFLMQLGLTDRHLKEFTYSLKTQFFLKNDLTWLLEKDKAMFELFQRIITNTQNRSIDTIYSNIREKNFDQPLMYITVGLFYKKQREVFRSEHMDTYIIQCTGIFPLEKNYYDELVELDFFNRKESERLRLEEIPAVFDPVHQEYKIEGFKLTFNDDIDNVITRIKNIGGIFSTYKIFLKFKVKNGHREEYAGIFTKIRFIN